MREGEGIRVSRVNCRDRVFWPVASYLCSFETGGRLVVAAFSCTASPGPEVRSHSMTGLSHRQVLVIAILERGLRRAAGYLASGRPKSSSSSPPADSSISAAATKRSPREFLQEDPACQGRRASTCRLRDPGSASGSRSRAWFESRRSRPRTSSGDCGEDLFDLLAVSTEVVGTALTYSRTRARGSAELPSCPEQMSSARRRYHGYAKNRRDRPVGGWTSNYSSPHYN